MDNYNNYDENLEFSMDGNKKTDYNIDNYKFKFHRTYDSGEEDTTYKIPNNNISLRPNTIYDTNNNITNNPISPDQTLKILPNNIGFNQEPEVNREDLLVNILILYQYLLNNLIRIYLNYLCLCNTLLKIQTQMLLNLKKR